MATLQEANKAREVHSDYLQKLGAHAILVDKIRDKGKETFGVIALCENSPNQVPDSLEIETAGKKKRVPLRTKVIPPARLE